MGHSIYSFVRKDDFFRTLGTFLSSNDSYAGDLKLEDKQKSVEKQVKSIILFKNMSHLSKYFENCNKFERDYIVTNKEMFMHFLKENKWNKGLQLLELFLAK